MRRIAGSPASRGPLSDGEVVARLRAGDQRLLESLVESQRAVMLAVARRYVRTREAAEDVVQETWLAVLRGLDRFEGRSSLTTWIMRILRNTAITRGRSDARTVPFSSLVPADEHAPAGEPEWLGAPGEPLAGHWKGYPVAYDSLPEEEVLRRETLDVVKRRIDELPSTQRRVIAMRDLAGCTPQEVCDALEVSVGYQRVLLHRARSRVRARLERHLNGSAGLGWG